MLILDTDHFSEFERASAAGNSLRQRLDVSGEERALTIVTAEEAVRGWLAEIRRLASRPHDQVSAYGRLADELETLSDWTVLRWDHEAADLFLVFRGQGVRIGTQDLKIACIALAHDATVLSRNSVDFMQVPGLRLENWLV